MLAVHIFSITHPGEFRKLFKYNHTLAITVAIRNAMRFLNIEYEVPVPDPYMMEKTILKKNEKGLANQPNLPVIEVTHQAGMIAQLESGRTSGKKRKITAKGPPAKLPRNWRLNPFFNSMEVSQATTIPQPTISPQNHLTTYSAV